MSEIEPVIKLTPAELSAGKALLESLADKGGEISIVPGEPGPLTKLLKEWEKKQ